VNPLISTDGLITLSKDIDPLADTVPPRHAVESEEEEDDFNLPVSQINGITKVNVRIDCHVRQVDRLVVATGGVGRLWAQGANLEEPIGEVLLDEIEVSFLDIRV
jgi:aspartate oxidase